MTFSNRRRDGRKEATTNSANPIKSFAYRRHPRDAADTRLAIAVFLGGTLVASPIFVFLSYVLMSLMAGIVLTLGLTGLSVPLMSLLPSLWLLWATLRTVASRLEVTPDGLRVIGVGTSQKIMWADIEEIEPLNRGAAVAAIFRWPFKDWNMKCSTGLSFSGYVRIRHKNGVLLFAPENRAELLAAMQTHLAHRAAVQIPVYQWSEAANVVATEIIQTLGR